MTTPVQITAVAQATAATPMWAELLKDAMVAAIAASGTLGASWLGKRRSPKAAQAEVNDQIAGASEKMANSWDKFVTRVERDNELLAQRVGEAEARIATLKQDIHDRNNWISALRGFAGRLLAHVDELEVMIRALGGSPPDRPVLPELPAAPSAK